MNKQHEPWHFDKKVPSALIITLLVQFAMTVWWASALAARVDALEKLTRDTSQMLERIVRIETRSENLKDILTRIERKLEAAPP